MRKIITKILAILTVLTSIAACFSCDNTEVYELRAKIFGGLMLEGLLFSSKAKAIEGELTKLLTDIDNSVNINGSQADKSKDTVLIKLNKAKKDEEVELDIHAYTMLKRALDEFYEFTGHLFNPAISPLVELWGVDAKNLDNDDFPIPTIEQVNDAMLNTDFSKLSVYTRDGKYYAKKSADNMRFDLGAQAKGYATDEAINIINKYKPTGALISLSGNVYVAGKRIKEGVSRDWVVAVRNPHMLDSHFAGFDVTDISVVTSGDNERFKYYTSGGKEFKAAHIIDGVTGLPLNVEYTEGMYRNKTGLTSVSVFNVSSERADVYGTKLILLGMERAIEFAEAEGLDVLLIGTDKTYAFVSKNIYATAEDSERLREGFTAVSGYGIKKKQA